MLGAEAAGQLGIVRPSGALLEECGRLAGWGTVCIAHRERRVRRREEHPAAEDGGEGEGEGEGEGVGEDEGEGEGEGGVRVRLRARRVLNH